MIPVTIDNLLAVLKEQQLTATLQQNTGQISVILKIEKREFPLFLRIIQPSEVLQLLVFMPTTIKPGAQADLGRLMHLINKELDVPGFGMDENSRTCFYRIILPFIDKQIDERILITYLKAIQLICESVASSVVAVAAGLTTFQEVMEKANSK